LKIKIPASEPIISVKHGQKVPPVKDLLQSNIRKEFRKHKTEQNISKIRDILKSGYEVYWITIPLCTTSLKNSDRKQINAKKECFLYTILFSKIS